MNNPSFDRFYQKPRNIGKKIEDMSDLFFGSILFHQYENNNVQNEALHTEGVRRLLKCDFHLIADELTDTMNGGDKFYRMDSPDANGIEFWPVDICAAIFKNYDDEYNEDNRPFFALYRVSSIQASEARGYCKIYPPKMAAMVHGHVFTDDRSFYAETHICGLVGTNWRQIEKENIYSRHTGSLSGNTMNIMRTITPERQKKIDGEIKIMMGLRLTERNLWHVAFGNENGPRMVLPTNPRGCLELFRSRELSDGEKRRAALKHWVSEHYRNRSGSSDDYDYIRNHLRGKNKFVWNGLNCEILVSEYDLEKNDFFKTQAADWRAMRKHNAIRFKIKPKRK